MVLDPYRAEFRRATASTRQALVQLQLAALDVDAQRQVAREEREGLSFHEGYPNAVKTFRAAYLQAYYNLLMSAGWLEQCRRKADVHEYMGGSVVRCDCGKDSFAMLQWSPPYGCRGSS